MNVANPFVRGFSSLPAEVCDLNLPCGQVTHGLEQVLHEAEADESKLAYLTPCQSEQGRKETGSYYTPVDVAEFFWNQFFLTFGIRNSSDASNMVRTHTLIEPAVGSGVLVFALLRKLFGLGVNPDAIRAMDLRLIDINSSALRYVKRQFARLNHSLGADLVRPHFVHANFLHKQITETRSRTVFFGNPPFIPNPRGAAWKNTFADFLHRCLSEPHNAPTIQFILPLSVAFSRDYASLRDYMRNAGYRIFASHFDNIPDSLFKSGKPQSANSNKANSQRCTILSAYKADRHRLFSTWLHRWSVKDRRELLTNLPKFIDVTNYELDHQFIRPVSLEIARYLQRHDFEYSLGDLENRPGRYELHVGPLARNFISVREAHGPGINSFAFQDMNSFYKFLGLLTSGAFSDYWRSVGDGFHVTRTNVRSFPISAELDSAVSASIPMLRALWRNRSKYRRTKMNSGSLVCGYDFRPAALSLRSAIGAGGWKQRGDGSES